MNPAPALAAERRKALRALLQHPLMCTGGRHDEVISLVRRHAPWLQEWLLRHTGWRLVVTSDLVRLYKTPARLDDPTRALRDSKSETPFNAHRYALLCLALAALERSDRQTTLGRLAEDIMGLTSIDPELEAAGFTFDLSSRSQRSDLVTVVRYLLELRILRRVHGEEQQFIAERGDVLYNVNRATLAAMLNVRRAPSTIEAVDFDERLRVLTEEVRADTDDARHQANRWMLTRRLLDDPVLYLDTLDERAREYYASQWPFITRQAEEATGLVAEVCREGTAMVDPEEELTDIGIPEEGTDGHITLLLAEYLAEAARARPGLPVGVADLEHETARLIGLYKSFWRKDVAEPGAEVRLCRDTLDRLEALGLTRASDHAVYPLWAIARYSTQVISESPRHD